ncbi:MAG: hypothetical protein P8Z37_18025 [Acidobacteriota bacterium]
MMATRSPGSSPSFLSAAWTAGDTGRLLPGDRFKALVGFTVILISRRLRRLPEALQEESRQRAGGFGVDGVVYLLHRVSSV